MEFSKYCRKEGIPAKMAPVPRQLSASCGVCVKFCTKSVPIAANHDDMDCCYRIDFEGEYYRI